MNRLTKSALKVLTVLAAVAAVAAWITSANPSAIGNGYDVTYTFDADFDLGALFNVNHDAPNSDQLQLNKELSTFKYLWVANAGEDTVSQIDTTFDSSYPVGSPLRHGREVARYRTWMANPGGPTPHGAWTGPAPSRTAVDTQGNAYILNRHFDPNANNFASLLPASLVKIYANGQFVDRNNNGVMDTSSDTNNDGTISLSTEVLGMTDTNGNGMPDGTEIKDERIAWIVRVGNNGGLGRALCIGTDGNVWVGLYNQRAYYKVNGSTGAIMNGGAPVNLNVNNNTRVGSPYGCAIDGAGRLYSANISDFISVIDTNTFTFLGNELHLGHANYGITVGAGLAWMAGYSGGREWLTYNPGTDSIALGPSGNSITLSLDGAGNRYIGSNNGSTRKYSNTGALLWSAGASPGASDSRGTIIDGDGNVWRIHRGNNMVAKHDGATGAFLANLPVGVSPYTYSDASGLTNLTNTSPTGTWTIIQDSGAPGTIWDQVIWNGTSPAGASITAAVRASDNQGSLGSIAYVPVTNGTAMAAITGQYIQVQMTLTANSSGTSPVLEDVRIVGNPPNLPPDADAGEDEVVICSADNCQGTVLLNASGSSDPDEPEDTLSYSWSGPFGTVSGETAEVLVPLGTTTITLTVTDEAGESDTDTIEITALDMTPPTLTAPDSVTVDQTACVGTPVTLGPATATDACGGTVNIAGPAPGALYPVGTTTVTFTATDLAGNQSTATSTVTVVDATAPTLSGVTASTGTLWPPNHQMVPVSFTWTKADCDPGTTCEIVSVSSNEPVNSIGDGNTAPDWEITGTNTVNLRSERQGPGSSRVYTITVRCVDTAGNATTASTTVTVPHDQGNGNGGNGGGGNGGGGGGRGGRGN